MPVGVSSKVVGVGSGGEGNLPIRPSFSNPVCSRGLELDELQGPFQLMPFYGSIGPAVRLKIPMGRQMCWLFGEP